MADTNLVGLFTNIADAIRYAEKSSGTILVSDFAERIRALSGGQPIPPTPIRPIIPDGTWQLKNTTDKKYVILGTDDDNLANAKFYRLLRTFGFPYTMNTESENLSRTLYTDDDSSMFISSDAPALFPNGVTVTDLGKHMHDNNLGEVAQHGSSEYFLCDTNKLVGDVLANAYATYTNGGGTKSQTEFVNAVKEKFAISDVAQGASYVMDSRLAIENAMGFFVDTVGIWGNTSTFKIDGIDIPSSTIAWGQYDWKANNYSAVGLRLDNGAYKSNDIYNMLRVSTGITAETMAEVHNIAKGNAVEFFWHKPMLTDDGSYYRTVFTNLKALVDSGEVEVITRKQYADMGEYVANPIKSISITRDGAIEVGTTDDKSKYTVTATYEDNTTANVSAEAIIDNSGVNTEVADTYTVTVVYRGYNASVNVTVVGGGMTYPDGLKDKDYWFIVNDTTQNVLLAFNTSGTITSLSNYDKNWAPSNTPLFRGTNGKYNAWISDDGGNSWVQKSTNVQHYSIQTLGAIEGIEKGDNIAMIEYSGNFELQYFN